MNVETLKLLIEFFDLNYFLQLNPPKKLLLIGGIMVVMAVASYFLCAFIEKRLVRWVKSKQHDEAVSAGVKLEAESNMDFRLYKKVMRDTRITLYLLIFGWGLKELDFGVVYQQFVNIIFICLCIFGSIIFLTSFIPFDMDIRLRRQGSTLANSQLRSLLPIIKGFIWAIGLTFLLDNLGMHVSTIIAGLGIMGVAVSLAGQAILRDFFSYLVILFEKPFRMNDFLVLSNGKSGQVAYIGPKTTRLRSLDDELVICANSELTSGILVNQGSVAEREVMLEIGISYNTPMPVVKRVPDILKDVVETSDKCVFDRACMVKFGEANYIFQLIYRIKSHAEGIREFMMRRSDVNLAIQERLDQENIAGAFPTRTIIMSQPEEHVASPIQKKAEPQSKPKENNDAAKIAADL